MHKWVSAMEGIEHLAVREWSQGLTGLTSDQIKHGLDTWEGEWPPTLPEYRAACLGKKIGLNEFGLDFVPEYYRQQPIREQSKLLSSDERDAQRAKAKERIKTMREAIK